MSLFNTLRRALGVNAGDDLQDETQMNPFDQAGLTGNETTGTVAGLQHFVAKPPYLHW